MENKIINGDTLTELRKMPDECVNCIVTSPPYFGLRDYGVEGQIGLEKTLGLYLEKMLAVTTELYRVLRKDGVFWLNHGDCYSSSGGTGWTGLESKNWKQKSQPRQEKTLPPKCLCMQNYRLILKMIDEQGWILRNICPWVKGNSMPSSVKDRLANKYEPVFLLVKSQKYFFDLDAIRKPHKEVSKERLSRAISNKHKYMDSPYGGGGGINKPRPNRTRKISVDTAELFNSPRARYHREGNMAISAYQYGEGDYLVANLHPSGKNPGDVFFVNTQPFKESHFATFPEKLIEPLIMAGCPKEICKKCGKARVRIIEKGELKATHPQGLNAYNPVKHDITGYDRRTSLDKGGFHPGKAYENKTLGWTRCNCAPQEYEPGIVLDPFGGAMTTALVAKKLGRKWIMIELSPEYCKMGDDRLKRQGEYLNL